MGGLVIVGDWGVTRARLWLVAGGKVRDGVEGPGIKACGDPAEAFARMTAGWREAHAKNRESLPALLCGTVGANIGWHDAGYAPAPATLADVCGGAVEVDGVTLLPGISTESNAFGRFDVMRSEEIQSFGWLAETGREDARLCLPGSHTKWVECAGGKVANVTTGFVGELYAVLREHSILAPGDEDVKLNNEFDAGVSFAHSHTSLVHALFDVRALAAANRLSPGAARSRLSGLLIGADCAAMLDVWGGPPDAVIGSGAIARGYVRALLRLGHEVEGFDGERAALAGLKLAAGTLGLMRS